MRWVGLVLLAACGPVVTPVFGPGGEVAYQVSCREAVTICPPHDTACNARPKDPLEQCHSAAAKYCPAGYRALAETKNGRRHVFLVVCGNG